MKKKILALILCAVMLTAAAVGGTLAYFTDTDAQENVFTVGNVKIDLFEDFSDKNNEENKLAVNNGYADLLPVVQTTVDGETVLRNAIDKKIYVENVGSEDAYVRVHIAIPTAVNDYIGFDKTNKDDTDSDKTPDTILHIDRTDGSYASGKWNWDKENSDLNTYRTTIYEGKDAQGEPTLGVPYTVYVVTYETRLERGDVTPDTISSVYLDSLTTNEHIATIKKGLKDAIDPSMPFDMDWKFYVVAEAGQADGFDDAFSALNEQFGTPGSDGYTAPTFKAVSEDKMYIDTNDKRVVGTDMLLNTSDGKGQLLDNGAITGNTITYTTTGVTVDKTTNPNDQDAYWLGYLLIRKPSYANADENKITFTWRGIKKTYLECRETDGNIWAWIAVDPVERDADMTYTFDWDGDGVYEAVYSVKADNIILGADMTNTAPSTTP